jgi:hypothetical protein
MFISRSLLLCAFVGVCLLDFLDRPVTRVLNPRSWYRRITLKGSSGGDGLECCPFCRLVHVSFHQGNAGRRWTYVASLKSESPR